MKEFKKMPGQAPFLAALTEAMAGRVR
jgi:hypothetical protein